MSEADKTCYYVGREKEALENYHTALRLNPNHSVALVNMARRLRTSGKVREAEQAYNRFVWKLGSYDHISTRLMVYPAIMVLVYSKIK